MHSGTRGSLGRVGVLLFLAWAMPSGAMTPAGPLPVEAFATLPYMDDVRISPNGRYASAKINRTVNPRQTAQMASALKDAGKTFRYIKLEDDDHYLSHGDTRLQFYRELDEFLAKYLH